MSGVGELVSWCSVATAAPTMIAQALHLSGQKQSDGTGTSALKWVRVLPLLASTSALNPRSWHEGMPATLLTEIKRTIAVVDASLFGNDWIDSRKVGLLGRFCCHPRKPRPRPRPGTSKTLRCHTRVGYPQLRDTHTHTHKLLQEASRLSASFWQSRWRRQISCPKLSSGTAQEAACGKPSSLQG